MSATGASLNFRSDNVATAAPQVLNAMIAANHGPAAAYGEDEWSALLQRRFSDLFETEVTVFPVSTGTAANALSLACIAHPWGGIYCHEQAHVHTSEGGATEAFTGGAKLVALPGLHGKLQPAAVDEALQRAERGIRNRPQPDAVSITQASEWGTVYRLADIEAIGACARQAGVRFHMDGARLANALATLGCTPAEMTWRRGVDILSFGATKNGGMTTDAIVVFDRSLIEPLSYRLRRAGQTWSKMRFAAAQLLAYVDDGLFVRLAGHANALAARLGRELGALAGVQLVAPVEANLVFAKLPEGAAEALANAGVRFGHRPGGVLRLVTRWDGSDADVDEFLELARRVLAQPRPSSPPQRLA